MPPAAQQPEGRQAYRVGTVFHWKHSPFPANLSKLPVLMENVTFPHFEGFQPFGTFLFHPPTFLPFLTLQ